MKESALKGSHTDGVRAFVVYNVQICYNYRRILF